MSSFAYEVFISYSWTDDTCARMDDRAAWMVYISRRMKLSVRVVGDDRQPD